MRIRYVVSLAALASLAAVGCGPNRTGHVASGPAPVEIFTGTPNCAYRSLQEVRGRGEGTLDPRDAGRDNPHDPWIREEARLLGGDAVVNYRRDDRGGRWIGTAVKFIDPSDPACYQ